MANTTDHALSAQNGARAIKLPASKSIWMPAAGWIFLLAFSVRVALIIMPGEDKDRGHLEVHRMAISLVRGEGLGNPYSLPTGPSADTAPGYPLLLAGIYKLAGTGQTGELTMLLIQAFAASLTYASLPLLAATLRLPVQVGSLAGATGALVPIHYLQEFHVGGIVFAALFLQILVLFTAHTFQDRQYRRREALAYGLIWGLALLFSPSLLPVGIAWALLLTFSETGLRRVAALRFCAITLVCASLCLLPWMIRNYYALGAPIAFHSTMGLGLHVSNNDEAMPTAVENMRNGAYQRIHPFFSREQAALVRSEGEVAYNDAKLRQALDWIQRQRLRFLHLTALRTLYFWFPKTNYFIQGALLWMLTLLACLGLAFLAKVEKRNARLICCIWLSYPLLYYVIHSDSHYRYPIYWTFLLFASAGLLQIWDRTQNALAAVVARSCGGRPAFLAFRRRLTPTPAPPPGQLEAAPPTQSRA